MLFHTWLFVVFFCIFYPVYLLVRNTRFRIPWLFIASYFFYGSWNPLYLLLIVASTAADFVAVLGMSRTKHKKLFLTLSIVFNLGLLGFFKYAGFITRNLNAVLLILGISPFFPEPDILLPVGISFFIFQSMTYSIDFYRGKIPREPNFIRYASFVSLFPQLVAGPIERANNLLAQLRSVPSITKQDIGDGLSLFIVGLFKKVVMADYLALYVDSIYGAPQNYGSLGLFLGTFAFGWQIYFDFCGYTDMARGIGRLMGLRLMLNFNNPYIADSLGDFWRRWHISLSTWFKDYVYIPLGGNKYGKFRTHLNMFLTMLISGVWHGANWTFIIWGTLHAIGRVLTRELEHTTIYRDRIPKIAKQMLVFIFVTFTWIFFRAQSIKQAWEVLSGIFEFRTGAVKCPIIMIGFILAIWAYQFIYESRFRRILALTPVRVTLVILMCIVLAIGAGSSQPFIYFQF